MSLNLLNLGERAGAEVSEALGTLPVVNAPFAYRPRSRWFPTRGLIYSVLFHEALFAAAVLGPWNYWLPPEPLPARYEVRFIKDNDPLLLPNLAPLQPTAPAASGGTPARRSDVSSGKLSAPAGRPFKGMVHNGPQVIVSATPKPDNYVQTIRQPELVTPPKLPFPLRLPNIIAIRPTMPVPEASSLKGLRADQAHAAVRKLAATENVQIVPPPVEIAVQNPRIVLPAAAPVLPPQAKGPDGQLAGASAPPPLPYSALGNSDRNLLVLSANAGATSEHIAVPPGELHGAFAVSPTAPFGAPSAPSGMALGGTKEGAGIGRGGIGTSASGGLGTDAGKSRMGNGSSAGTGAGTGSGGNGGRGAGSGNGSGDGTGAMAVGRGSGGGVFPGISIQGGSTGAPLATRAAGVNVRTPGSYALTIVASGASGGGLKDYGVFHNEPVYTIYVDIAGSGGTSWTLQYAVIHVPGSEISPQNLVTPPYPVEKHRPGYPAELADRYEGRLIVVQGVIDTDGKVQKLKLVQSPHPLLAQALLDALKLCTFGAAEAGDRPVAVKFLMGAPVEAILP